MDLNKTQQQIERFTEKSRELGKMFDKINKYFKKAEKEINKIERHIAKLEDTAEQEDFRREVERAFSEIEYKFDDLSRMIYKVEDLEKAFRYFWEKIDRIENKI